METADEDIWQDIRPGDVIALPDGQQGLVISVLAGAAPAPENADVIVLTTSRRVVTYTKAVLDDEPVVQRWPPLHAEGSGSGAEAHPVKP